MAALEQASTERLPLHALPARDWAAAARTLADDGVVMLDGALDAAALAQVEAAVAESLAHPSDHHVRFFPQDDATFFEDTGQNYRPLVRTIGGGYAAGGATLYPIIASPLILVGTMMIGVAGTSVCSSRQAGATMWFTQDVSLSG